MQNDRDFVDVIFFFSLPILLLIYCSPPLSVFSLLSFLTVFYVFYYEVQVLEVLRVQAFHLP
jgi:hypothetical protein